MISLQLGGPLLADPSITMSLSPLTSRSSTPPTPLTGLTIPSPGPDDNFKSIPLPPSPPTPEVNIQDRPGKSVEDAYMLPADVPLPPSPKRSKQALPFRRPRVSNPLDRVVSSNQRTSSGRRVSSALQYAMTQPHDSNIDTPDRVVSSGSDASLDLASYQEMVNEAMSSDEDIEEIPWDSSVGFGGQLPELLSDQGIVGDEDEAWMGFVRAQLNTLFPDFFDPTARDGEEEGEGEGDVSISTIASSDLTTPPIGTRLGPGMGLGLGRGVPNIRSEIGGLTEEIERLRGVVSGLADGMRAAQLAPDIEGLPDEVTDEGQIPEAFIETAHLSMDIIRLIHTRLGGIAVSDTELFSKANLLMIKRHFQVLQGEEDTDPEVAQ